MGTQASRNVISSDLQSRASPADLARLHCRLAVVPRRADLAFMGGVADGMAASHTHSILWLDGVVSGSNIALRLAARLL
jgi:hypothetical protein